MLFALILFSPKTNAFGYFRFGRKNMPRSCLYLFALLIVLYHSLNGLPRLIAWFFFNV